MNLYKDFHQHRHLLIAIPLGLALSACAVEPLPLSDQEQSALSSADRERTRTAIPAITASLTLEEAIARAVKYNLDHRTRMMEQALATGQLEAGRYDLLPKLMADAGYDWRDKENIRNSTDSVTGLPSLSNPSISSEKEHATADLGLTWNLLDFGVSYYTAQQNADRLLIAHERRRKAMHTLIQNVRAAFWRAVAADKLESHVKQAIQEAESALVDSRRIETERVKAPNEALRYQRNLLENLRLLEGVDRELASARIELAALIGVSPGTRFSLAEPAHAAPGPLTMATESMEEAALTHNADLREQSYNVRIAAVETRKALVKLLPGISLNYEYRYDDDKYLINQEWMNAGVKIGFNLLNLLSAPSQMNLAETGVRLAENRRMALQMSVLTQIHLARFQYADSLRQYLRAVDISDVDGRLAQLAVGQEQSELAGKLDRIAANVTAILSTVRRYHAMAKVQEAASRIQATMGIDPSFDNLETSPLPEVMKQVQPYLQDWPPQEKGAARTPQAENTRQKGEPAQAQGNTTANAGKDRKADTPQRQAIVQFGTYTNQDHVTNVSARLQEMGYAPYPFAFQRDGVEMIAVRCAFPTTELARQAMDQVAQSAGNIPALLMHGTTS